MKTAIGEGKMKTAEQTEAIAAEYRAVLAQVFQAPVDGNVYHPGEAVVRRRRCGGRTPGGRRPGVSRSARDTRC